MYLSCVYKDFNKLHVHIDALEMNLIDYFIINYLWEFGSFSSNDNIDKDITIKNLTDILFFFKFHLQQLIPK